MDYIRAYIQFEIYLERKSQKMGTLLNISLNIFRICKILHFSTSKFATCESSMFKQVSAANLEDMFHLDVEILLLKMHAENLAIVFPQEQLIKADQT